MERKLPFEPEIEVYLSEAGEVCITADFSDPNPQLIPISPDRVPVVIRWLKECLEEYKQAKARGEFQQFQQSQ